MNRKSPVVTVTVEEFGELSDWKIGSRILAALAHTPSEREYGSYHAIAVTTDESVALLPETVLEESYDFILNYKISMSDEYREKVGQLVRENLLETEKDTIIVGRS